MPFLTRLTASDWQLVDSIQIVVALSKGSGTTCLQHLDLHRYDSDANNTNNNNNDSSAEKCFKLLGTFRHLTFLDVSAITAELNLGESVLQPLSNLKQLRHLHLASLDITDEGVKSAIVPLRQLETLHLSHCPQLTDEGVKLICENLRKLSVFSVSDAAKITERSLYFIASNLEILQDLNLSSSTEAVTNRGIEYLATCNRGRLTQTLQMLNLFYCVKLTDDAVPWFLKFVSNMRYLYLGGTANNISHKAFTALWDAERDSKGRFKVN
jgi:hypothetical protein